MFRDLKAEEIECRVQQATQKGLILLLYKDARCDMNILDESVTPMNWKREHTRDNANCIVSLWDEKKQQWISKEDTGTESNTEKEKGLASDSFKRACFNWGIGRELYTSPFIWIKAEDCKTLKQNEKGKWECKDNFEVFDIEIENKVIVGLSIKNTSAKKICFTYGTFRNSDFDINETRKQMQETAPKSSAPKYVCADCGTVIDDEFIANGTLQAYGRYLCTDCGFKAKRARGTQ